MTHKEILLLWIIFSLSCCKNNDPEFCCSCREQSGIPVPYKYPPTADYLSLPYTQKIQKLQIPEQQLTKVCTYDLVETYLTYPLINILGFSNNFKSSFAQLVNDFNGAKELVNRGDGASELVKRHKLNNFTNFDLSWESQVQFGYKWKLMLLELTLSQDQVLNNLSTENKNDLFKSAMTVWNRRKANPELFGYTNVGSNDFLIANVLLATGYRPFKEYVSSSPPVRAYIGGLLEGSIGTLERSQIDMFANQYLNTLPK